MLASYPTVETKNKSIYRKVFLKSLKRGYFSGRGGLTFDPRGDYLLYSSTRGKNLTKAAFLVIEIHFNSKSSKMLTDCFSL